MIQTHVYMIIRSISEVEVSSFRDESITLTKVKVLCSRGGSIMLLRWHLHEDQGRGSFPDPIPPSDT